MTAYLGSIWRLRHFWMALVRNDLRNRYRRSIIGIGWSLLHPIAMTVVLCVVFCRLYNQDLHTFAPHVLSGLTFWSFMTAAVMQGCQSFFLGESYIRQHPAPLAIYPLRIALGAGFHFLLGLAVVVVLVACTKGFPHPLALLSLAPTLTLLFVVGWSLAVCMGVVNVMFQDAQHLIEVAMQVMFYITPIIYPVKMLQERNLNWLADYNPFAILLELIQRPLLAGQMPSTWAVSMGSLIGLLAAGVATLALVRFEKRMIFYL